MNEKHEKGKMGLKNEEIKGHIKIERKIRIMRQKTKGGGKKLQQGEK